MKVEDRLLDYHTKMKEKQRKMTTIAKRNEQLTIKLECTTSPKHRPYESIHIPQVTNNKRISDIKPKATQRYKTPLCFNPQAITSTLYTKNT